MLIQLEWVDLCGKTTLIDKLKKINPNIIVLTVPHILIPKKDDIKQKKKVWKYYIEILEDIQERLIHDNPIIILDRFHLSEIVYWKVIRWYDSSDMEEYIEKVNWILHSINKQNKFWMIYLSDDTESIRERYLKDWDEYVKEKKYYHNLKREYNKQIEIMKKKWFKVVEINVFKDNDYRNKIIEEIFLSDYVYKRNG